MNNYKKVFFGIIILFAFINLAHALGEKSYFLELKYDNGVVTKENIQLISGEAPDSRNQPESGYLLKIISFEKKELYSIHFNFPLSSVGTSNPDWFDEEGNQVYFPTPEEVGVTTVTETTLSLV